MDRFFRIRGGLFGLLIGDALGVPYEFNSAANIAAAWNTKALHELPRGTVTMAPPESFARAHKGTPPGTWSDDGAQALCLLSAIIEAHGFDPLIFSQKLVSWYAHGYMAVDKRVFDVGNQTRRGIDALRKGTAPLQAGPRGERDQGNGSLMRVLPVALWHRGTDAELVRDAAASSMLTHGHIVCRVACALYCLMARCALEGVPRAELADAALDRLDAVDVGMGIIARRDFFTGAKAPQAVEGYEEKFDG